MILAFLIKQTTLDHILQSELFKCQSLNLALLLRSLHSLPPLLKLLLNRMDLIICPEHPHLDFRPVLRNSHVLDDPDLVMFGQLQLIHVLILIGWALCIFLCILGCTCHHCY